MLKAGLELGTGGLAKFAWKKNGAGGIRNRVLGEEEKKKKKNAGGGNRTPDPQFAKEGKEMGLKGIEHATWGKEGKGINSVN